ncbi:MAG: quinate 5-dehydrogenase, partial [Actinobacteria bacterium]|nr:quinate 5-dehydrogenase [Actinomycetota bacterium]
IRSWTSLRMLIRFAAPVIMMLPFAWLYPTGSSQEEGTESKPFIDKAYEWADIIAGDWLYIRKYMPQDMSGKWIVTNTTTSEDVELCRSRGVEMLVTSTPRLEGRSFGTNVIEAVLVALEGTSRELSPERYAELLREVGFKPDVIWLQK